MRDHRPVGAEHHAIGADALHVIDKSRWQPAKRVGRCVDEEVWKLDRQCDELVQPGKPDVPAHNKQLWKVEEYVLEIRNETAALGALERSRMPDLRAEGYAQFDAGRKDGVVAPVVGGKVPEPR